MNTDRTPSLSIEDELKKYGNYATNTVGVSMKPLFRTHRDTVVLSVVDREIKKYDIVLYKLPDGRYILHRVIGIRDGEFIIRGDNTFTREHIPGEWILAYVTSFTRKGKKSKTTDLSYRIYSRVWHYIYPVRYIFFRLRGLLSKIKHKIKG